MDAMMFVLMDTMATMRPILDNHEMKHVQSDMETQQISELSETILCCTV